MEENSCEETRISVKGGLKDSRFKSPKEKKKQNRSLSLYQ